MLRGGAYNESLLRTEGLVLPFLQIKYDDLANGAGDKKAD